MWVPAFVRTAGEGCRADVRAVSVAWRWSQLCAALSSNEARRSLCSALASGRGPTSKSRQETLSAAEYRIAAVWKQERDQRAVQVPRTLDDAHLSAVHRHLFAALSR